MHAVDEFVRIIIVSKKGGDSLETTRTITFEDMTGLQAMTMAGTEDRNLRVLEECFGKTITFRDNTFI